MTAPGMELPPGNHHGSACVIGSCGVLVLGRSGSGKTQAVMSLMAEAARKGHFARLVSDDRVVLGHEHGRCILNGPPGIAGLAEMRGSGIAAMPCLASAVLGLAVFIETDGHAAKRVPPENEALLAAGAGVALVRIWPHSVSQLYSTLDFLHPGFYRKG